VHDSHDTGYLGKPTKRQKKLDDDPKDDRDDEWH
jgi:hypothetical protein